MVIRADHDGTRVEFPMTRSRKSRIRAAKAAAGKGCGRPFYERQLKKREQSFQMSFGTNGVGYVTDGFATKPPTVMRSKKKKRNLILV